MSASCPVWILSVVLAFFAITGFARGAWAQAAAEGELKVTSAGGYKGLLSKTESAGAVKVIVRVRASFTPEPALTKKNAEAQRGAIRKAQNALITELSRAGLKPEAIHKYEYVPYVAMMVDRATLRALVASPNVTSVQEDVASPPAAPQPGWSMPLIGATRMQADGITGTGITVAVLDTGVDKEHPYLAGAVVSEACYSSKHAGAKVSSLCPGGVISSTATGSAMPYGGSCPKDTERCDHGTHVAGIIAGRANVKDAPVGSGVAPGASLVAIQVFSRLDNEAECQAAKQGPAPCVQTFQTDYMKGLERIYKLKDTYKIAAVNMSLGGGGNDGYCDKEATGAKSIIDTLRAAGIATIISAGNDGFCGAIGNPACISSAVSVGATDWNDKVASYSDSASFLTLLAPGSQITSAIPDGKYVAWDGTSMAAPHVAGAWALIKQKNPTAPVDTILSAFVSKGAAISDEGCPVTKKRINVKEAYDLLQNGSVLFVSMNAAGFGTVAAQGLQCTSDITCTGTYAAGTVVTVTATPSKGYALDAWTGCGSVSQDNVCEVTMDKSKAVTVSFARPPVMTVSPLSLNLGQVKKDVLATRQILVRNGGPKGCGHLIVTGAEVATPSEFSIVDNKCTTPLARGESCAVTIGLLAGSYGVRPGLLVVTSNDAARPAVSIKLAGTAVPPVITPSTRAIHFGVVKAQEKSKETRIKVGNTGLSDLNITFVAFEQKEVPFQVTFNDCLGKAIAKGGTCTLGFTFAPLGPGRAEVRAGILSNDPVPARNPMVIILRGVGK